jgi:hypothetical protein
MTAMAPEPLEKRCLTIFTALYMDLNRPGVEIRYKKKPDDLATGVRVGRRASRTSVTLLPSPGLA